MLKLKAKQAVVRALFEQWDKDGDGQVTHLLLSSKFYLLTAPTAPYYYLLLTLPRPGDAQRAAGGAAGSGDRDLKGGAQRDLRRLRSGWLGPDRLPRAQQDAPLRRQGRASWRRGANPSADDQAAAGGGEREGSSAVMASFKLKEGKDAPQVQDQIRDALSKNAVRCAALCCAVLCCAVLCCAVLLTLAARTRCASSTSSGSGTRIRTAPSPRRSSAWVWSKWASTCPRSAQHSAAHHTTPHHHTPHHTTPHHTTAQHSTAQHAQCESLGHSPQPLPQLARF